MKFGCFYLGVIVLGLNAGAVRAADPFPCNNAVLESNPEQAIGLCRAALAQPGLEVKAISGMVYILGRGHHRTGRAAEAITYYNAALAGDPDNAEILVSRGWAGYSTDNKELAHASLEAAIKADVKNERAWELRGYLLQTENRVAEALESYSHALRLNPNFGGALLHRASLEQNTGMTDAALEDLDRLIAIPLEKVGHGGLLDGNGRVISFHAAAHGMRAELLASRGRIEAAESDWNKAIAIEPSAAKYEGRAQFLQTYTTGRIPEALRDIRAARTFYPNSIYYGRLEAWLMGLNGQTDEALVEFGKLQRQRPQDISILMMKMDLLRRAGRGAQAQAEALKIFDHTPTALWPLVAHLAQEGRWKGHLKPTIMTPELKKALEACNKTPAC